jgi:carbamoyltransferase
MVKKREGYRPFAPSVLEEDARLYFELPDGVDSLPFMMFVVKVREEVRERLGAITHVDRTAQVHTVSKETNPRYWELINAFKQITGVGVVLNTSFNDNVEPIVDSVEDGIVCFLTTGLDYLVIGDYLIRKQVPEREDWRAMKVSLPAYVRLVQTRGYIERTRGIARHEIHTSYEPKLKRMISARLAEVLDKVDGERTLGELLRLSPEPRKAEEDVILEITELWSERLVRLRA